VELLKAIQHTYLLYYLLQSVELFKAIQHTYLLYYLLQSVELLKAIQHTYFQLIVTATDCSKLICSKLI